VVPQAGYFIELSFFLLFWAKSDSTMDEMRILIVAASIK
jgi:hypothetical protein